MASFLDELSDLLLSTAQDQADVVAAGISGPWAHGELLRLLQRLEVTAAQVPAEDVPFARKDVARLLRSWAEDGKVVGFCRTLATLLVEHGMASSSDSELLHLVSVGLARELGLDDALESHVATVALDRLSHLALDRQAATSIRRYPLEVRLQIEHAGRRELTALGKTFLQLTGRDRLRWLLNLEALQSTGSMDAWRLSTDGALELTRRLPLTISWGEGWDLAVSSSTMSRLLGMGLIVAQVERESDERSTYDLTPIGRELLGEIARGEKTALSLMARALLDDSTLSLGPPSSSAQKTATADAVARQARLVAHELNNALVPVKTSLGRLYREAKLKPIDQVLASVRGPIDRGLGSAFEFIRGLADVSRLVAAPREVFEVLPAIFDAIAEPMKSSGVTVVVRREGVVPRLTAPRHLLVQAITNLVRNAIQATDGRAPRQVEVTAAPSLEGRSLRIQVDDNGPGVPPDRRALIFQDGVSQTAGGLGLGLGLVRSVVEELGGAVDCQTSELGGASFILTLPAAGVG